LTYLFLLAKQQIKRQKLKSLQLRVSQLYVYHNDNELFYSVYSIDVDIRQQECDLLKCVLYIFVGCLTNWTFRQRLVCCVLQCLFLVQLLMTFGNLWLTF